MSLNAQSRRLKKKVNANWPIRYLLLYNLTLEWSIKMLAPYVTIIADEDSYCFK